jgi:hypothetical protein
MILGKEFRAWRALLCTEPFYARNSAPDRPAALELARMAKQLKDAGVSVGSKGEL